MVLVHQDDGTKVMVGSIFFLYMLVVHPPQTLIDAVMARIPSRLKLAAKLMANYPKASMHDVKVENIMNGMRGMPCILWEISETDESGVKYHGKTLRELEDILPKWHSSEQISPEAMLWFLYTATVPTRAQLEHLAADLIRRAELPVDVQVFCDSISPDLPPTTHLIMSFAALSRHSKFAAALQDGVPKTQMWRYALEDALDGTARTPMLAARIHSNLYRQGRDRDVALDSSCDLAHNFAGRMGRHDDAAFVELTRLYWALHMDHGSNVSAHAMREDYSLSSHIL
jgi:citrate synthase